MATTAETVEPKAETAALKEKATIHDIPRQTTSLKDEEESETEDAESQGLGRALGALVGGGAAMAGSAYVAALNLPHYIDNSSVILLVVIGVFAMVLIGGMIGIKVVKMVGG